LNIKKILEDQLRQRKEKRALIVREPIVYKFKTKYTVIHYYPDMTIKATYHNVEEAAYKLKLSKTALKYHIYSNPQNPNYILKHGEKIKQSTSIVYPEYEKQPAIKAVKPLQPKIRKYDSNETGRIRTRTRSTIDWYIGGELFRSFDSVLDAAEHFGVATEIIRRAAIGKTTSFRYDLKYGDKKQIKP